MRRPLRFGLVLGAVVGTVLACAEALAPHDPRTQHRELALAAPSRLHWVDDAGRWRLRPFVYARTLGADGRLVEDRTRPLALRFGVTGEPYRLLGLIPLRWRLVSTEPAGQLFWLGTDALGRDLWARLLVGARLSLLAALLATVLCVGLGSAVGLAAGLGGRALEAPLTGLAQTLSTVPWLYLLLAVRAALPLEVDPGAAWLLLAAVVGLASWPRTALLVRTTVRGLDQQGFVVAARAVGVGRWRLLTHHLLPAVRGTIAAQAGLLLPRFLLAEATLSLLGVGVAEPQPSWGGLLRGLEQPDAWGRHGWLALPALALVLLLLALHTAGARSREIEVGTEGSDAAAGRISRA